MFKHMYTDSKSSKSWLEAITVESTLQMIN